MIYQSPNIVAFLDKYPITDGHTLVLPRPHFERFDDLPSETLRELFVVVQRLSKRIKERMSMEAAHISVNDGRAANQLVPHVHVHIIPRRTDDNATFIARKLYTPDEMEAIRRKLVD
jgi:histidine triad (HIT) family protein